MNYMTNNKTKGLTIVKTTLSEGEHSSFVKLCEHEEHPGILNLTESKRKKSL